MDAIEKKRITVVARIKSLEESILRAREYLQTGAHADWPGFRPWFVAKEKDGRRLPPHKDWVRNVYLPRMESALRRSERVLERFEREDA